LVIDYFRTRKLGPESIIEDIVANQIQDFIDGDKDYLWTAGSPPIGAGMPDLIAVSCEPQVFVLEKVDISASQILAYLKAVGCARKKTIIERLSIPEKTLLRCLDDLVSIKAVSSVGDIFTLPPIWRKILPEIVTIEVKVKNWKDAVDQAARNRIFSHRSYVALPDLLARRIRFDPTLKQFGIGLLSVTNDGKINTLRRPRHHPPLVWKYYYDIAMLVAKYNGGRNNAIYCSDVSGSNSIS
jgi:hypothetical protein